MIRDAQLPLVLSGVEEQLTQIKECFDKLSTDGVEKDAAPDTHRLSCRSQGERACPEFCVLCG